MAMRLIDETQEVACRTAEADAIRAKTGGTAPIPYDFQNGKGFSDAIAGIPSGGSARVKYWRPPDMPDITSLPITEPILYVTYDASLVPEELRKVSIHGNSYPFELSIGYIENGQFVSVYSQHDKSQYIDVSLPTGRRFWVVECKRYSGRSFGDLYIEEMYNDTVSSAYPYVEVYANCAIKAARGRYLQYITAVGGYLFNLAGGGHYDVIDIENSSFNVNYNTSNFSSCRVLKLPKQTISGSAAYSGASGLCSGFGRLIEFDASGWDVSNNASFRTIFNNCYSLVTLNISGWDMRNCNNYVDPFLYCYHLKNFLCDNTILPSISFSLVNSHRLTNDSLANIANALPEAQATITLSSSSKTKAQNLMGIVSNGKFVIDEYGDTSLEDFITLTKGWTIA